MGQVGRSIVDLRHRGPTSIVPLYDSDSVRISSPRPDFGFELNLALVHAHVFYARSSISGHHDYKWPDGTSSDFPVRSLSLPNRHSSIPHIFSPIRACIIRQSPPAARYSYVSRRFTLDASCNGGQCVPVQHTRRCIHSRILVRRPLPSFPILSIFRIASCCMTINEF